MFKRILLPIDVNQESSWSRALPVAEQLALDYGAEIRIVSVVPPFAMSIVGDFFPKDFEKKALGAAHARLDEIVARQATSPGTIHKHLAHGPIYEEILAAAEKLACDLIVLAAHRPELKDYLLGPNAARVVRHATQSVFVVREA